MRQGYSGVKFHSSTDLSCGYYLEKSEAILEAFSKKEALTTINQAIELFNIQQFFDNNIRLKKWSDADFEKYKSITKKFVQIIAIFFAKIDEHNFLDILNEVDIIYLDDFWFLINRFKIHNHISIDKFAQALAQSDFRIHYLLAQRDLVNNYGEAIANHMIESEDSAELLVSQFLVDNELSRTKLWFPKELTGEQREEILRHYIESNEANPNYLKIISEAQSSKDLPLHDKTKLDARKKHDDSIKQLFSNNSGLAFATKVCFSKTQKEEVLFDYDKREVCVSYGVKWIEDNCDYPTLWNNFIYLFGYVDKFFRSQFVSQPAQIGALERVLGLKGVKDYIIGMVFNMSHNMFNLQMIGYYQLLSHLNIKLESLFKWFFEEYLNDEFQAKGFIFSTPSEGTTDLEKCKLLASEIDSVLKQFRLFVIEGHIDRELFQMSSAPLKMGNIPSFCQNKYVYPCNNVCKSSMYLLFSDQSSLSYTEKTQANHESFFALLKNETMNMKDFEDYQKSEINWLSEHGCIIIKETGELMLNLKKVSILKDLYYNQVGCLQYLDQFRELLDALVSSGEIHYGASLFSKPEQDYIDFVLNKAEFSNGLDLRNKYIHGTHPLLPEEQKRDYIDLLKIMVLIIIKINEEFCLREEQLSK